MSLQHTLFKKHSGVWCAIQYDSKMYFDSGEQKISLQLLQDAAEQTKGENPIILTYKDPDEPVKSTPGPRGVDLGALRRERRIRRKDPDHDTLDHSDEDDIEEYESGDDQEFNGRRTPRDANLMCNLLRQLQNLST